MDDLYQKINLSKIRMRSSDLNILTNNCFVVLRLSYESVIACVCIGQDLNLMHQSERIKSIIWPLMG